MGEAYRTWIILFVGEIQYFNRSLEEYCVTFQDGSSDSVTNDDIDGTDLILL